MRARVYKLVEPIAEGSLTELHLAHDERAGRYVAVKTVRTQDANQLSRRILNREIRAMLQLDHPHIVEILDYGETDEGQVFYAMEYLLGGDLARLLSDLESWAQVHTIADQILAALAHAHANGVVHRDLKPENVLIAAGDPLWLKLADFGIAKLLRDRQRGDQPQSFGPVGTPHYMAPEQIRGDEGLLGPATDLYAFGCMLYEMVAGETPFDAPQRSRVLMGHLERPVPPLRCADGAPVPPQLAKLVTELLEKSARQRPNSAADIRRRLEDVPPFSWTPPFPRGVMGKPPSDLPPVESTSGSSKGRLVGMPTRRVRAPVLVGRDATKAVLQKTAERALATRESEIIVLHGSRGMGKRRVLQWLGTEAAEKGWFHVVEIAFHDDDGDAMGMLRRVAAQQLQLDPELLADWRKTAIELLGPSEGQALARWLLPAGGARFESGVPMEVALAPLRAALTVARRDKPLLLIVSDAHHGDSALVNALLTALAGPATSDPARLVVVTHRATADEALAALGVQTWPHVSTLELEPLSPDASLALLRSVVPLPPDAAEPVLARAAGSPEQLVALGKLVAVELGEQRPTRERVEAALESERDERSSDLAQLRRNLAQRGDGRVEVLFLAALAGPQVRVAVLRRALVEQGMSEGEAEESIERWIANGPLSEADAIHLRVRPTALREACQAALRGRPEGAALHTCLARALEEVDGDQVDLQAVAGHLDAADAPDAIDRLARAAEHALTHGELTACERLLARALRRADDAEVAPGAATLLLLGSVTAKLALVRHDADMLERGLDLLRQSDSHAAVVTYFQGAWHCALGHYEAGLALLEEAVLALSGSEVELEARVRLADAARVTGRHADSDQQLARAAKLSQEPSPALLRLMAHNQLEAEKFEAAEEHARAAVALAEELGDRWEEAHGLRLWAEALLARHQAPTAKAHAERALALFRELGDGIGEAEVVDALARCARDEGQLSRAIELANEAMELASVLGDRSLFGRIQLKRADHLIAANRTDEADTALVRAINAATATGDNLTSARACLRLARLIERDSADDAWILAERARGLMDAIRHPLAGRCRVYQLRLERQGLLSETRTALLSRCDERLASLLADDRLSLRPSWR